MSAGWALLTETTVGADPSAEVSSTVRAAHWRSLSSWERWGLPLMNSSLSIFMRFKRRSGLEESAISTSLLIQRPGVAFVEWLPKISKPFANGTKLIADFT